MICPVCKGSGVMELPHTPSDSGGWMDKKYLFSDMKCGACGGSGIKQQAASQAVKASQSSQNLESSVPTASEQFDQQLRELKARLGTSRYLPRATVNGWLLDLQRTSFEKPESIELFRDILAEFEWLKPRCRPERDIFSVSISEEMRYDKEMREIGYHLNFLVDLFQHVSRLVEQRSRPFGAE